MPQELQNTLENEQILAVLKGNLRVKEIIGTNTNFKNYVNKFKKKHPKSQIEYQGFLSLNFRDLLIEQHEIKSLISNNMKEKDLYAEGEGRHQIVYDFIDNFYTQYGRGPNILELYHQFLNFKAHELRGKMNIVRRKHPNYYFI